MTKVLVTGGAGFIGSHLVDRFLQEGFKVRVLDSLDPKVHPFGRPAYLPPNIEFIAGSVTDRDVLKHALQGVDVVSHQAAYQDYMPDFSRFMNVNAVNVSCSLEAVRAFNREPLMWVETHRFDMSSFEALGMTDREAIS